MTNTEEKHDFCLKIKKMGILLMIEEWKQNLYGHLYLHQIYTIS